MQSVREVLPNQLVVLLVLPDQKKYLTLSVCLNSEEEKARQEILSAKQHFPHFYCPVTVVC